MFGSLGRMLIVFGLILSAVGLLIVFFDKIPGLGRLPGDIYIEREGFRFYFPLMTGIIISIVLTVILNLFFRR